MSPEYQIKLKVDVPSTDELNNLVDQIRVMANPYQISAREIRGGFAINEKNRQLDREVKLLYETQEERLTNIQIADRLEVSLSKLNSSLRRLKDNEEIGFRKRAVKVPDETKIHELQEFDNSVKSFLLDEGKKLTVLQIAEKLGVSAGKLGWSVRRLKDRGEIENTRKTPPNRIGKYEHGPKIMIKQELKKLIEENLDKHYTLQEFKDQLGGKITREWVRVLLKELKEEGLGFVTHREHKNMLKDELAKQKEIKKQERQQIIDEVKKLLMEGYSGPKIQRIMGDKGDSIIHVITVINMLRAKGEIAKKRKPKRSLNEIVATDNEVKKLYNESLSYHEISAITGLDNSQIDASLNRLNSKGEIVRKRLRTRKNK